MAITGNDLKKDIRVLMEEPENTDENIELASNDGGFIEKRGETFVFSDEDDTQYESSSLNELEKDVMSDYTSEIKEYARKILNHSGEYFTDGDLDPLSGGIDFEEMSALTWQTMFVNDLFFQARNKMNSEN